MNCGRPTIYGNPYIVGIHGDKPTVLRKYRERLENRPDLVCFARRNLKGRKLSCPGCGVNEECHVDILIEFINAANH